MKLISKGVDLSLVSIGSNFVDILESHAERHPMRRAFSVEGDVGKREIGWSYRELAAAARRVAVKLSKRSLSGKRFLLLLAPGADYIVALFACWYAGACAVPLYPPRRNASYRRFALIADDCGAEGLLATGQTIADLEGVFDSSIAALNIESMGDDHGETLSRPSIDKDQLAVLQYTSGSTGDPKGVCLRQRHLIENCRILTGVLRASPSSVGVTWLPPYHDMGLIGGLLAPVYAGFPVHVMPPALFLQRPLRWLEAITRHRASISAAPNFAFDLCVRRATPSRMEGLDLSSWRVACNGAEPVRAETLRRFADTFAPARFDPRAFMPCFGMAEATLMATAAPAFGGAVIQAFDRSALGAGRLSTPLGDAVERVGSGRPVSGVQLAIVEPNALTRCEPGVVGEIWLAGDTVADGYWQRPDATLATFGGRLPGSPVPWLRTGDLGAIFGGELFVTGRIKEMIVIHGHNHDPQDIEATALAAHRALRPHGAAAFALDTANGETLGLVLELERGSKPGDLDAARTAVIEAVSRDHQLQVGTLAFVDANAIPRTSSGKLRRLETRARLLANETVRLDVPVTA